MSTSAKNQVIGEKGVLETEFGSGSASRDLGTAITVEAIKCVSRCRTISHQRYHPTACLRNI
jgi:hypothetical protein